MFTSLSSGTSYPAGRHSLLWDGADESGRRAASGVYLVRLREGDYRGMQRVLLLK